MLLSFKTELKPNNKQTTLFRKASGIARHAYNWACATVQECLANGKKAPSAIDLHKRLVAVANIRKDAIHKLTHYLAKNHSVIKIEDLSIKAFLKNHKLAGAIADCGMFEFRRQLEYKCQKFSSRIVLVDRSFPSSQICSNCGNHRHKMPLKQRVYVCPDCGHTEDRDLNAAKNIERWFEGIFIPIRSDQMASSAKMACGVDKPLKSHLETTVKQEVNSKPIQLSFDFA